MTATVEGKQVKIGDVVGFKCDVEQYGIITGIKRSFGDEQLTLKPCGERFHGEYIGGDTVTTESANRCWID